MTRRVRVPDVIAARWEQADECERAAAKLYKLFWPQYSEMPYAFVGSRRGEDRGPRIESDIEKTIEALIIQLKAHAKELRCPCP